jgi:hypothetical protein
MPKQSREGKFRWQRKTGGMRERCLQSLAILLAGLFSAERSRPRAPTEADAQASARLEPREVPARDPKLEN